MTLSAEEFDLRAQRPTRTRATGPMIEEAAWGYTIRDGDAQIGLRTLGAETSRFAGLILLMAAAGLWVLPDSLLLGDLIGIKVALAVMFLIFGGYLFWAGRHARHPEFQVDLQHREIRIGTRTLSGKFRKIGRVEFDHVGSVFLLRSKDHSARPRLFLRLADFSSGLEIAAGSTDQLESLKHRLTRDLSGQTDKPVAQRLGRHHTVAA